jgi:hypothetical protein
LSKILCIIEVACAMWILTPEVRSLYLVQLGPKGLVWTKGEH